MVREEERVTRNLPPIELPELGESVFDRLGLVGVEGRADSVDDSWDGIGGSVSESGDEGRFVGHDVCK